MCVPSGSHICLICLLLYGVGAKAEAATTAGALPKLYDKATGIQENRNVGQEQADMFFMQKDYFMTKLLMKYGDGVEMSYEGFEHLLHNLGLGGVIKFDHDVDCHEDDNSTEFLQKHSHHNHTEEVISYSKLCKNKAKQLHEHDDLERNAHDRTHSKNGDSNEDLRVQKRATGQNKCLAASVMLRLFHIDKPKGLTKDMFEELCPSLISQIEADSCHSSHSRHDDSSSNHDHDHDDDVHGESTKLDLANVPAKVWGFSAIAVMIISLVGLLGVAVIPIMQKVFYNHMLQFLVALAVGALSGDALLHLFPHALAGGHDDEAAANAGHEHDNGHDDTGPKFKGVCGLAGIFFFFITERGLAIFTEYQRRRKQRQSSKCSKKSLKEDKVGEKLAKSECGSMLMSVHPNKDGEEVLLGTVQALRGYVDEAHSEHCTISFDEAITVSHEHEQCRQNHEETCVDGDEYTSMIDFNKSSPKPHGHGHGHGHSHMVDGVPDSVAAVAWMIILGDGIHNFSDGLAIGAAFTNSITGGFSTSIAVFCHELPHEIGDFAMLLRAGMSTKQAIVYNCLSSILCFIGMLIGVAIGNLAGASLWIFAMVGGMFLYIALVDMLPELSSVETKKGEHPLFHLLLQSVGMCIGAGIMLVIALYEEDLKTILD